MRNKGKLGIALIASAATALLVSAPAASAADPAQEASSAYADVDGDGTDEIVTLSTVDEETASISVRFDGGSQVSTTFPATITSVVPKPRPVDVDGNGKDEIATATAVGANTVTFGLFSYDSTAGKLSWLTDEQGAQYTFYEGGGVSAVSDYGCFSDATGQHFEQVGAELDPGQNSVTYSGERSWFTLDGTTLRFASHLSFEHVTRDDPILHTDQAACAA